MNYSELDRLRRELVRTSELWQFDILNSQKLAKFASERSISFFNADKIKYLWQAGLLRADVITCPVRIDLPSLTLIGEQNGLFLYSDMRQVPHRSAGYGGIFQKMEPIPENLELYFHPFRLFVLYQVDQVFRTRITSTQFLMDPEGFIPLSKDYTEQAHLWTSGEQCAQLFEQGNRVAELAIVLEPAAYEKVFHHIRWNPSGGDDQNSIIAKLNHYRDRVGEMLRDFSNEEIGKYRSNLCCIAECLDDNQRVHMLLRLGSANECMKFHSALGAAMVLKIMAEIIRRAAEKAKGVQFPEEDEMGFGYWMKGARQKFYGSERILDAPLQVRRDFLTRMGLDYGVKAKCYLEGETEYGALTSAGGNGARIEFVNLRGRVVEKNGKGLAFAESLKNDKKSHVFSIVVLDRDSADNVRMLENAVRKGDFFGRFFIMDRDFEFANFTIDELVDIALSLAIRNGHEIPTREEILPQVRAATSGKEFFAFLKNTNLCGVQKGAEWGKALMDYANQHQEFPQGHQSHGKIRPVVEARLFVLRAYRFRYADSIERYEVDPEAGILREKRKKEL